MTEQVDNIMRLANVLAVARVRRYVAATKQGDTNSATRAVEAAEAALREAVREALTAPSLS